MKKLFLVAAFAVAGITGAVSAKDNVVKSTKKAESKNLAVAATKCYRKAVDDFGHTYYVQVPCPPIVILPN